MAAPKKRAIPVLIKVLIRSDLLDTTHIDKEIAALEEKKARLVDGVADGMFDRGDPAVSRKFREIDEELCVATTRKQEILAVTGTDLDPDSIAAGLVSRVHDLTAMLESLDIEDQRSTVFGFCKRIVADVETREIIIETDLAGLAQEQTLPGLPIGLCNNHLPESAAHGNSSRIRWRFWQGFRPLHFAQLLAPSRLSAWQTPDRVTRS